MSPLHRCVLRASGVEQALARPIAAFEIALLLGVEHFERIACGEGWSMYVDEDRAARGLPRNSAAVELAGVDVLGTAVVLPDADFHGGAAQRLSR